MGTRVWNRQGWPAEDSRVWGRTPALGLGVDGVPRQVPSVSSWETAPLLGGHTAVLAATMGGTALGAGRGHPGETVSGGIRRGQWGQEAAHKPWFPRRPASAGAVQAASPGTADLAGRGVPAPRDRGRECAVGNSAVVVVVVAWFCVDVTRQFGCEVQTRRSLPAQGAAAVLTVTGWPPPTTRKGSQDFAAGDGHVTRKAQSRGSLTFARVFDFERLRVWEVETHASVCGTELPLELAPPAAWVGPPGLTPRPSSLSDPPCLSRPLSSHRGQKPRPGRTSAHASDNASCGEGVVQSASVRGVGGPQAAGTRPVLCPQRSGHCLAYSSHSRVY